MARRVYLIKFRDGSTRKLAADSEQEARKLAREHYVGNIQSVKQEKPETWGEYLDRGGKSPRYHGLDRRGNRIN